MKNNKGYTLIELLAIVTVLSIIVGLSSVAFSQVQSNVLNKDYDNLKSYIETSALQYANDTGIYGVLTVQDLIEAGYVTPDDKNDKVHSPVDNEDITCYKVKIEYDSENDTYNTKFVNEKQELVDGKCTVIVDEKSLQICRVEGSSCTTINENTWFNENIVIGVKDEGVQITSTDNYYEWTPTGGTTPTIEVTSSGRHSVVIKLKNEVNSRTASKSIKIDRTDPTFEKIENNKIHYKDLESGVNQVCFYSINPGTCTNITSADKGCVNATTNGVAIASGAKYACADDKAGNVTDEPEGLLNTISLAINESKSTKTIIDSNKYTKIVIEGIAQNNSKGITAYAFTTSSTPPTSWTNVTGGTTTYDEITQFYDVNNNTKYYFWVKYSDETTGNASITINQLISEINTINVEIDEKNSGTVKIANSSNYSSIVIKGTAQNNNKGIKAYTFTKSTTTPTSWTNVTGGTTTEQVSGTYNVTENTTYYFWVKYGNDTTGYASIVISQLNLEVDTLNVEIDSSKSVKNSYNSDYYTKIVLKGIAHNNTKGIKAYAFTTSTTTPSSSKWTTVSGGTTKDQITPTYQATENRKYYFWVKYSDNKTNKKMIEVSNLTELKSESLTLSSRTTSTLSGSKTISNLLILGKISVNNGNIKESNLSGTKVSVTAENGTQLTGQDSSTSNTTTYLKSYSAHSTTSCSYVCNNGGSLSGKKCTGSDLLNQWGEYDYYVRLTCSNSVIKCTNSRCGNGCYYYNSSGTKVNDAPSTSCPKHYTKTNIRYYHYPSKQSYSDSDVCNKSCSGSEYELHLIGKMDCIWQGDYDATCKNTTSYYCDDDDVLKSKTCYYCTQGTINSSGSSCKVTTYTSYTYWEYKVTINYYKLV